MQLRHMDKASCGVFPCARGTRWRARSDALLEGIHAKIAIAFSAAAVASFALACGSPPVPPTSTTAPAGTGGIGHGADPSGSFPSHGGATVTSGAPASPIEGKCPEGSPRSDATDREKCLDSCKGQDDTVPLGSRCISAKASCTSLCNQKFRKN